MTAEIHLIEWKNDHFYRVEENRQTYFIPSVTTRLGIIKKEGLDKWRGDIGNREADLRMNEAANRGKRIHWAYEIFLKGGAVIYDPWQAPIYLPKTIKDLEEQYGQVAILRTQDEMADLDKLKKQTAALNPEILHVELKVYDLEKFDAGTIDNVLKIEEGNYLIAGSKPLYLPGGIYINDLKTGSYVDDEDVWLQLAPYAAMFEKRTGTRVAGALVTHTGSYLKTGIPGLKTHFRPRETLLGSDYQAYRHAAALWDRNNKDKRPQEFSFPSLITMNTNPKEKLN